MSCSEPSKDSSSPDGGADASSPDGGADASSPDGGGTSSPDGGGTSSPDGGADASSPDGGADASSPDGGADASSPDGGADADASSPDGGAEAGTESLGPSIFGILSSSIGSFIDFSLDIYIILLEIINTMYHTTTVKPTWLLKKHSSKQSIHVKHRFSGTHHQHPHTPYSPLFSNTHLGELLQSNHVDEYVLY
jgi:hypothetical protein